MARSSSSMASDERAKDKALLTLNKNLDKRGQPIRDFYQRAKDIEDAFATGRIDKAEKAELIAASKQKLEEDRVIAKYREEQQKAKIAALTAKNEIPKRGIIDYLLEPMETHSYSLHHRTIKTHKHKTPRIIHMMAVIITIAILYPIWASH